MPTQFVPQTFTGLRELLSTEYGADAYTPASDSPGSTLDPVFNALALLAIQIQQQLSIPLSLAARLATSTGADVDSFVAPFGFTRLPGSYANGLVTFSTASPVGSPLTVPLGTIVQTALGVQYVLVGDAMGNPTAPVIGSGDSSVQGSVVCLTQGTAGNTPAGTIAQLYAGSGSPYVNGINQVTNAAAFTDAANGESDAELKKRFLLGMENGRYAVESAILAAVAGVQVGLTYSFGDHINPDGSYHAAFFSIIVNVANSAAPPPSTLLTAITAAVLPVRSAGIEYVVVGPTLINATVTGNIVVQNGFSSSAVTGAAAVAVQDFVNGLGLNADGSPVDCSYAQIVAIIVGVPGVQNVTGTQLNGSTQDIVAPFGSEVVMPALPVFTTS
jgi:uncharacterized phage protein gp47/JayE